MDQNKDCWLKFAHIMITVWQTYDSYPSLCTLVVRWLVVWPFLITLTCHELSDHYDNEQLLELIIQTLLESLVH